MKTLENIIAIIHVITLLLFFISGPFFMYIAFENGIENYFFFFLLGFYMFCSSLYIFYKTYTKIVNERKNPTKEVKVIQLNEEILRSKLIDSYIKKSRQVPLLNFKMLKEDFFNKKPESN